MTEEFSLAAPVGCGLFETRRSRECGFAELRPGVIKAVHEFVTEHDLKLILSQPWQNFRDCLYSSCLCFLLQEFAKMPCITEACDFSLEASVMSWVWLSSLSPGGDNLWWTSL